MIFRDESTSVVRQEVGEKIGCCITLTALIQVMARSCFRPQGAKTSTAGLASFSEDRLRSHCLLHGLGAENLDRDRIGLTRSRQHACQKLCRKTVESFQLDKIVVGSGAVLATLNKALLVKDRIIDDRLGDWLSSEEPQMCLGILKQMESLLHAKHDRGVRNIFQAPRTASIKDKNDEAIRLFQKHKDCFHFLLTTEVW